MCAVDLKASISNPADVPGIDPHKTRTYVPARGPCRASCHAPGIIYLSIYLSISINPISLHILLLTSRPGSAVRSRSIRNSNLRMSGIRPGGAP